MREKRWRVDRIEDLSWTYGSLKELSFTVKRERTIPEIDVMKMLFEIHTRSSKFSICLLF